MRRGRSSEAVSEYAAGARGRWRRRGVVLLVVLAVGVALSFVSSRVRIVRGSLKLRWLEEQCANFTLPEETIVYEQRREGAARLLGQTQYVSVGSFPNPERPIACRTAPCWDQLEGFAHNSFRFPKAPAPVMFLHLLRTKSGVERIVAIVPQEGGWSPPLSLAISTHVPNQDREQQTVGGGFEYSIGRQLTTLTDGRPVAFHAGQVDANDPSRFSMRFEGGGGKSGWVDGRLLEDGNVKLELRVKE